MVGARVPLQFVGIIEQDVDADPLPNLQLEQAPSTSEQFRWEFLTLN